jgi:hypothetical protein
VEEVDIGDILPQPQCSSLGCVSPEPTGVQGRRIPACENRGPFDRTEEVNTKYVCPSSR